MELTEVEVVVCCEHGGNDIPASWRKNWIGQESWLQSHRGLDFGALELAQEIAESFGVELHAGTVTRLLVDLNRDSDGPTVFCPEAFALEESDHERLLEEIWRPHRCAVTEELSTSLKAGRATQLLSIHSFTPVWQGIDRGVDIGFLIDPDRQQDLTLALALMEKLGSCQPQLRLKINEPYSGLEEGIDQSLRNQFRDAPLAVLTLEVNQRFPLQLSSEWQILKKSIVGALKELLAP